MLNLNPEIYFFQKKGSDKARIGVLFNFGNDSPAHALAFSEIFNVTVTLHRLFFFPSILGLFILSVADVINLLS